MNFSNAGFSMDERLIKLKLMLMKLFAIAEVVERNEEEGEGDE